MREEKIFEELNQRSDPLPSSQHHTIIAKKTSPLGLIAIPTNLSGSQVINAPHNHHQQLIEPIALTADHQASHSGFVHSTSKQGTPFKTSDAQLQPNSMVLSSASGSGMSARSVNLSKTKLNMSRQVPQRQQQVRKNLKHRNPPYFALFLHRAKQSHKKDFVNGLNFVINFLTLQLRCTQIPLKFLKMLRRFKKMLRFILIGCIAGLKNIGFNRPDLRSFIQILCPKVSIFEVNV